MVNQKLASIKVSTSSKEINLHLQLNKDKNGFIFYVIPFPAHSLASMRAQSMAESFQLVGFDLCNKTKK